MRVSEYVTLLSQLVDDETIIVPSHTLNVAAWLSAGRPNLWLGDFNMGLATPVGLGLALALPHRRVVVLDSDGGVLLLASALTDVAAAHPSNLVVVVHDNESALGFPTHTAGRTDIAGMARGAGIQNATTVTTLGEFETEFSRALEAQELAYIVAKSERSRIQAPEGVVKPKNWEGTLNFVRALEQQEGRDIIGPGWRMTGLA